MNYDEQINNIVIAIKGDKAIIQPWRNKAASRLEEAQAFVRMGKTTSNASLNAVPLLTDCTCVEGAVDGRCPTHGF